MMKVKEEAKFRYVADFETAADNLQETYVWAWAVCGCHNLETQYGTDIKSFFKYIQSLPNASVVYFHNLKFDGSFILNYLLSNGWSQTHKSIGKAETKTFNCFVSDMGQFYSINLKFSKKKNIYIYDSLKKLPFSVKQIAKNLGLKEEKGEIDYKGHREEGGILSQEDKDYIRRDVEIVAQALQKMFFDNGLYGLTIGSDCMKYYQSMTMQFDTFFPRLDKELDEQLRKSYKGGFCYVNPLYQDKRITKTGSTYDYNSMYPSQMHSSSGNKYPIGFPIYYKGEYEQDDAAPVYIQHIKVEFVVKEGHVPFIQDKQSLWRRPNEYITDTDCDLLDLWLTSVDLQLLYEQYDILYIEYIEGYKFASHGSIFDDYINHYYKMKEEATVEKNKVKRQVSKLFLNNLYGKFGTSANGNYEEFRLEDGVLKRTAVIDEKKTVYIPVAAFITSYARRELIHAIQENYVNFIYCDTDSIHILGTEAKGIKIHDTKLGHWAKEAEWDDALFLRQKTYAEHIDGEWDIKCAGLPEECRKRMTIDDFYIGSVIPGKLMTRQVKGGIVLVESTFQIKEF